MKNKIKYNEMTDAELNSSLNELTNEKYKLKVQSKTGQLQNSARIKTVKANIARVKTEQTKRDSALKV